MGRYAGRVGRQTLFRQTLFRQTLTFPSVLWCCWLGLLTCKTVSRITYTVLVETLNPAQSNPIRQTLFRQSAVRTTQYIFSMLGICRNSTNWEEIGMGRGVGCIESTALIEALRGAEPGEGIPVGLGAPSSGKVTTYFQHNCTAPDFRDLVRRLSNRYTGRRPIQLQSATRRPDCAWTIGIASVGTVSVGIVWCVVYP